MFQLINTYKRKAGSIMRTDVKVAVLTDALTEAGNLKTAVRRELREAFIEGAMGGFEVTPKGDFVIKIAEADGKPVYAKLELSVTESDKLFDEPKSRKKAQTEAPVVPSLFD